MTLYTYRAKNKIGTIKKGTLEATSEKQIFELLKKHSLLALSIKEHRETFFNSDILEKIQRITVKTKFIFFRQLSTMIIAGLSIIQALRILKEQEEEKNRKFSKIIDNITSDIEGGSSFSESLSKYPKIFLPIHISMIKSGEASGKLDEVLDRLAFQLEKDYALKSKIKGAMAYPVFVILMMFVVSGIIVIYVIPQIKSLFIDAGADLPFVTQILIAFSDFVTNYWWLFLFLNAGFIFGLRSLLQTTKGKSFVDMAKLSIPIFKSLFRNIYMARFSRTLGTLIASGLPILDALNIVGDTVGNIHYKKEISFVADQVENGVNLAVPLEASNLFPTMVSHMVEVGEKTGSIDLILFKIADYYENEVNNTVSSITTLLEPILLVFMGLGVGVIVGAVLLPIYKLSSAM